MALKNIIIAFLAVTILTGGLLSWFASEQPDGLEWSIAKVTGKGEIEGEKAGVYKTLAGLQEKLAFLPDYSFKKPEAAKIAAAAPHAATEAKEEQQGEGSKLGTSLSGLIGGLITLGLACAIGFGLKMRSQAT